MIKKILPYAPTVGSWLIAAALQISGYVNPQVARILVVIGIVLLIIPAWSYINRIRIKFFLIPSDRSYDDSTKEPVIIEKSSDINKEEEIKTRVTQEMLKPALEKIWNLYKYYGEPAYRDIDSIFSRVAMELFGSDDKTKSSLGHILRQHIIPMSRRSHNRLVYYLKSKDQIKSVESLEELFCDWYDNYRILLNCISQVLPICVETSVKEDEILEWRKKDDKLKRQLNDLAEYSNLHIIRKRTRYVMAHDIPMHPLTLKKYGLEHK